MTILLEFYDTYSLQQLLAAVNEIAENCGYRVRRNPTLETYAKAQYHGIIHVYVSINKESKFVSVKMDATRSNVAWESRCELGWESVLIHNLTSTNPGFEMPNFEMDVTELSEEVAATFSVQHARGTVLGETLTAGSSFTIAGMLAKPSYTLGLGPEDLLTSRVRVIFLPGMTSSNILGACYEGTTSVLLSANLFFIEREALEELIGCPLEMLHEQFKLKDTLQSMDKAAYKAFLKNGEGFGEAVLIDGGMMRSRLLEEVSDTSNGLLFRMIQKLPKEKMSTYAVRIRNVTNRGVWFYSNAIKNEDPKLTHTYHVFGFNHTGSVRKVYFTIDKQKITIKDEILS